ncbi:MAG: glycine--tRNA ligase subunit beta [Calditerrivibrio nitroreducens]|uniref:Glycine--tRNA ligase beta subunit n=1 Tax=Calditerrivibrio nitroreducens TaxID=477976 RepID=A0A2J6WMC2_9BACT|nr:MAG: glycine--tRNA ligase subunit beta [Calditerrivibrio nitroreducens]
MSYYFLEILSEEIPADFVNVGIDYLVTAFENLFKENRITFEKIVSDGTPRRLFVWVSGLVDHQPDQEEEIVGPPASAAFDPEGNLTNVALNFAKAKQLDLATLKKINTPKGEYLAGKRFIKGRSTKEIISENIVKLIQNIPFKKTMRWGDKSFRFARPVKSFISLYDGELLPFGIDGIEASDITAGHRFMWKDSIKIDSPEDYFHKLKNAFVVPEKGARREMIVSDILSIAHQYEVDVDIDESLLDTVTNLVEYPFAVLGSFSEEFLQLPEEVLITSMKNHQKYFYTKNRKNGKISNYFIGISNTKPVNDNIRKGYERVLRARLKDAAFFFENDKNVPLESRVEELKKVVYQEKLGTSYEKMERFREVSRYLTEVLNLSVEERKLIDRTAYLCKADLMTEMVYEFPELQGVMGREYGRIQGEPQEVYIGIYEHYLPKFSGDKIPATITGAVVSIADKIDTICGCFSIGLIPTGNNDPYALRRNTIGIIQIIRQKSFRIDIDKLVSKSLDVLKSKVNFDLEMVKDQVMEFIKQRYKQVLISEGIASDAIDASIDLFNDLIKIEKLASTLSDAKGKDSFNSIAQSYKRINNILKKANHTRTDYNSEILTEESERKLLGKINCIKNDFMIYLNKEEYGDGLNALLQLEPYINEFFDKVMVMVEDRNVRENRLSMLCSLKQLFDKIGNLSMIN